MTFAQLILLKKIKNGMGVLTSEDIHQDIDILALPTSLGG